MGAHPYRQAFEARDLGRLTELLADDASFHSPVISDPGFEGRESVAKLLEIALDVLTDVEYTHELGDENAHLLVSNARVLGKPIKTTTLLEFAEDGKIREIWVMARPLVGVAAIAEAVGSRLAELQSPRRAAAVRALSKPLAGTSAVTDAAGGRLIGDLNRSTS